MDRYFGFVIALVLGIVILIIRRKKGASILSIAGTYFVSALLSAVVTILSLFVFHLLPTVGGYLSVWALTTAWGFLVLSFLFWFVGKLFGK